jgi:hypothetical protein
MTDEIAAAQWQLDRCSAQGIHIGLVYGELRVSGSKPSPQGLKLLERYEMEIRQLLGDDGKAREHLVHRLGGTLASEILPATRTGTRRRKPNGDNALRQISRRPRRCHGR